MKGITKKLNAVSFESASHKLTDAQKALLKLLSEKLKKKEILDRDEILEFYLKHIKKDETYQERVTRYGYDARGNHTEYYTGEVKILKWRDHSDIRAVSTAWFKTNLGSVILKGKLFIIPVIEI